MATISKRQIELEVRANNLSNRPLDEVVRSVNELSEALEVQARLAEQGQGSVDDLVKTYDKLSKAGSALIAQTGVVERVDLLRESVAKAEDRVKATTKALDEYKASIAGVAKLTGTQAAELSKLEKAAERSGKSLDTQSAKLKRAMEDAERIGVTTEKWAQAQDALAQSSKRLSSIQSTVTNNLDKYADTIARVAKEQQELDDANRAMIASREAATKAEAAFNKERAENVRKFKEADYAKLFDELDNREKQARIAIEAATREQKDLAAAEQVMMRSRQEALASQSAFDAERNANLRKFQEADYARLFDELAAAEAVAKRESDELEAELRKLGTTSDKATDAQRKQAKANLDLAKSADGAEKEVHGLLGQINRLQKTLIGGERTSLGFFQRLRGEVLSLIAAYAGFQGAIDLAAGALYAFRAKQATNNKLLAATDLNQSAATAEYKYLEGQAERLGIRLRDLAEGYSSFRIAAKQANMTVQDTRFIFESIAEAGSKMQLTPDNMKGIFKALDQLVSKGRASSEELKEQLGDRLPGVMNVAAKKFGVSVEEFMKRLEKGEVNGVKAAMALARGMNEAFGGISIDKSMTAVEGRFQTAMDNWKRTIAESGLVDAYTDLLKRLTDFLKSQDGKEVAEGIGRVFAGIADVISVLIKNIEVVKVVLQELFMVFSAFVTLRFGAWVIGVIAQLDKLAVTISMGVLPAATALTLALGALMLIPIGVWAYKEFETFRKAVDLAALGVRALWEGLAFGLKAIGIAVRTSLFTTFDSITYVVRSTLASIVQAFGVAAKAIGKEGLAGEMDALAAKLRSGMGSGESFVAQISKEARIAKRELESLRRLAGTFDGTHAKPTEGGVISPITGLPLPPPKKKKPVTATGESGMIGALDFEGNKDKAKQEAEKYANLLSSLEDQVRAVTAQSRKKDKDDLATHLLGIENQYEGLYKKLKELNAKDAARLKTELDTAVKQLKFEATKDFYEKQAQALEGVQKKFIELDARLSKGGAEGNKERAIAAVTEQFALLRKEIEGIAGLDQSTLDGLLEKLKKYQEESVRVAEAKFDFSTAKDAAAEVDNMIAQRDERIKQIEADRELNIIGQAEAYDRIAQVIADTQPQIEAASASVIQMLEALRGREGIDTAAIDSLIIKMQMAANAAKGIRTEIYGVNDMVADLSEIGVDTMDSLAQNIAKSAMGFQSWSDGIKQVGKDFAKMAAEMLMNIAKIIAQEQMLAMVRAGMKAVSSFFGASVNHEGGVVGSTGRTRNVASSWFANAPRYHSGGIAGLAADEYPAILKKNEEVLTTDDPRNILNGGGAVQSGAQPVVQDVKVINAIDSGAFVSEGLSTSQGTKAILNFITTNRNQVKSILG